jgi:hypothetical protein
MSDRNEQASRTGGGMHRPSRHDGIAVLLLSFARSPQRCDGRTLGNAHYINAEQFSHRLI